MKQKSFCIPIKNTGTCKQAGGCIIAEVCVHRTCTSVFYAHFYQLVNTISSIAKIFFNDFFTTYSDYNI